MHAEKPDVGRRMSHINIIGVLLISCLFYFFGAHILGVDPTVFPDWARHLGGSAH